MSKIKIEKTEYDRLIKLAYTDNLTGVGNRNALQEVYETKTFNGVLYIDLDKFSSVNNTFGHAVGDEVLVLVGELLSQFKSTDEYVFRIGGDEFIILGSYSTKAVLQSRAQELVSKSLTIQHSKVDLTLSIGALFMGSSNKLSLKDITTHADSLMYSSKKIEGSAYSFNSL